MFARSLLVGLLVAACVPTGALALTVFNGVPAVTGRIVGPDGVGLANATVSVHFMGTKDPLLGDTMTKYEIKKLRTVTGPDGSFSLERCSISLLALKAKFVGAEIRISAEGYRATTVQAINMWAFGGPVGVFIIGLIDAQGDDFDTPLFQAIPHAFTTVKESKFSRVYEQIFAEPLRLEKVGGEVRQRVSFDQLYQEK